MSRVTFSHLPSRHSAVAFTSPAGVSRVTTVLGSRISVISVSSNTVTTQTALDPDMACARSPCRTMKPASAPATVGGTSRFVLMAALPRGSNTQKRRNGSPSPLRYSIFSAMPGPGRFGTPPVTTRPISPSQWASTMDIVRFQRIDQDIDQELRPDRVEAAQASAPPRARELLFDNIRHRLKGVQGIHL